MKTWIALSLVSVALTGCTSTYNREVLTAPSGTLQRNYSVVVEVPENGRFDGAVYQRSGQMTADALRAEFLRYSTDVKLVATGNTKANYSGINNSYYVLPQILHWEERATEWSGKPDRIKIKVEVFDTATMSPQSAVIFSGKSKWFTLGGDHPQELLPKPIRDYLETLY